MTAWMSTMTGSSMAHTNSNPERHHVPFGVMFKAVVGFAVFGLIWVGAFFAFVRASESVELISQILALLVGAVIGAYSAWRAAGNASTKR